MDVRNVEVEIHELVLHGFGGMDGSAIAESLQAALRTRLAARSDLGKSRTVDRMEAPAIELAPGATAPSLGRAVAERVYGSILQ